jgi:DNA-binding GntR family transcriptional regulator
VDRTDRVSQSQRAYEQLRDEIVRWELPPRTHLNEVRLADRLSVSRTPLLEPYAARLCARGADRHVFGELRVQFDKQRAQLEQCPPLEGDYAEYYVLIKRLDTAIDESAGNPYLRDSLAGLRTHLQQLRQIAKRRPPRMLQTVSEHLAICTAIHDGDETVAAHATAVHINNCLRNILAVMTEDVIGPATLTTPTTAN